MGKNLYHHQNISWIFMFNIKTKLLKFDDRAENDKDEGTDESNRCEMIVDSLSDFEYSIAEDFFSVMFSEKRIGRVFGLIRRQASLI